MSGKRAKQLDRPRWGYRVVETALARVLGIDPDEQHGWFRARIVNFRRLGLAPPSGRGRVVCYSLEWSAIWFLALALNVRHRIDPKAIVDFINAERATLSDLIGRAWQVRVHQHHILIALYVTDEGMANVSAVTIEELAKVGFGLGGGNPMRAGRSVTLFDLTNDLRALGATLVGLEHDNDDNELEHQPKGSRRQQRA